MVFSMEETTHFSLHFDNFLFVFLGFFHEFVHVFGVHFLDTLRLGHVLSIVVKVLSVWVVWLIVATELLISH